jgi:hypothetical protein
VASLVFVALGLVALVSGRRLFWLFVAILGFVVGWLITPLVLQDALWWQMAVAGLILAAIGAWLAVVAQKLIIGVAGFVAGAALGVAVPGSFGIELGNLLWLAGLIGGVLGALLLASVFDWGLILLSSFVGGALIALGLSSMIPLTDTVTALVVLGFGVAGVIVQSRQMPH